MPPELRVAVLLGLCACLEACRAPGFRVQGSISADSTGPAYRDSGWTATPEGCTRDRFDTPPAPTRSLAALLWERPSVHDPPRSSIETTPDAPLRLELAHSPDGSGLEATLHTQRLGGVLMNAQRCQSFHASTWEEPAPAGQQPTLGGNLTFDCRSQAGHFTGSLHFTRCAF